MEFLASKPKLVGVTSPTNALHSCVIMTVLVGQHIHIPWLIHYMYIVSIFVFCFFVFLSLNSI